MEVIPMRTYCMVFGYDGSDYHGMQIQMRDNRKVEGLRTIEGEMEECLERLGMFFVNDEQDHEEGGLLKKIKWSRVGRTDKGVHSVCQVVSFRAKIRLDEELEGILKGKSENKVTMQTCERLRKDREILNKNGVDKIQGQNPLLGGSSQNAPDKGDEFLDEMLILDYIVSQLNKLLQETKIRVFKIIRVTRNFDARTDCSRRQYEYIMPEFLLRPVRIGNEDLNRELLKVSSDLLEKGQSDLKSGSRKRKRPVCTEDEDGERECEEKEERIRAFELHQANRLNNYGFGNDCRLVDYDIEDYSDASRRFRLSDEDLGKFQAILNEYLGTHSFHNFTSKSSYDDSTSWRHIEEIKVARLDPKEAPKDLSLIKIIIKGQSFLLHQIRKMVALSIEIFRGTAPSNAIQLCFLPEKFSIHLAPSQGLLLDRVFYHSYNTKRSISTDKSDFAIQFLSFHIKDCHFVQEMESFKLEHIYSRVFSTISEPNNK
ncbi:Pus1p-like type II pseudousynthas TruA [Cryptosporidium canis]|uniref:Pus1p-like type II pseudousynthas TruA n=1 Tax=Cryptosporidium canis TaxID=195482 RepID=A0ABQ8P8Z7_9CRYT|nr:Pus1p-like type II pseudousynthas TruA [Cryptosporidium canis]KAJ1612837.1 Pus1p-like type II pseudousynthas TruA [Cryptosporidium canis]